MPFNEAKDILMKKYSSYGVTEKMITDAMKDGIENYELSVDAVYNGLRMALSTTLAKDIHEYFTVEDVMSVTGESREETTKRIEEMLKEIRENGGNPDDYAIEIPQLERMVYFFPNGLK